MSNLYSKIHRLKNQGWTWDYFLQQIETIYPSGIDEKTLYSLYRNPSRKANSHINKILVQLHDQCFPSPFPADTQAILGVYNRIIECKKHCGKDLDIKDFLVFLKENLNFGNSLRKARLHWIIGDIHLDLLPSLRNNGHTLKLAHHKSEALMHYNKCIALLKKFNANNIDQQYRVIDNFTFYKAEQNILACYLNSLPTANRYQDPLLKKHLLDSNFIQATKDVLSSEPYQWIIARNGLRFSSINKNKSDCLFFYQALLRSNKAFSDYDYSPLDSPAISKSLEFNWAINEIIRSTQ